MPCVLSVSRLVRSGLEWAAPASVARRPGVPRRSPTPFAQAAPIAHDGGHGGVRDRHRDRRGRARRRAREPRRRAAHRHGARGCGGGAGRSRRGHVTGGGAARARPCALRSPAAPDALRARLDRGHAGACGVPRGDRDGGLDDRSHACGAAPGAGLAGAPCPVARERGAGGRRGRPRLPRVLHAPTRPRASGAGYASARGEGASLARRRRGRPSCLAAALAGGIGYLRAGGAGRSRAHLLSLAQTLLVAQAAVGLLLLADRASCAGGHALPAHGALALGIVLAPWFYAAGGAASGCSGSRARAPSPGALAARATMTGGL